MFGGKFFAKTEGLLLDIHREQEYDKIRSVMSLTERLYYDEVYLKEFDATVLEVRPGKVGCEIRLDRSAFYPTSGGQPFDTGSLDGVRVTDVFVDRDGEVWHVTDAPLETGAHVHGAIDWERRFDHMQQHAGEHMLANAAWRHLGGYVEGLHLGKEISTIDVQLSDGTTRVDDDMIRTLEDDVNEKIWRDVPIRQWFPSPEELEQLPLRKAPTVKEHIRIVQIGEVEYVACGGTHPSSAGQIGMLKIVDARPSRGKMRLTFICGKRAYDDYRKRSDVINRTARGMSTAWEQLDEAVDSLKQKLQNAVHELAEIRNAQAAEKLNALQASATEKDGWRIIAGDVGSVDMATLREMASKGIEAPDTVLLLEAYDGENALLTFAASSACPWHMGKLLGAAAKACGGKGGGRPDFAQGSAPGANAVAYALNEILN